MTDQFRPIAGDPGGEAIMAMFDVRSTEWLMSDAGDYQTGAAEVFKADGSNYQKVVILEWPARVNNSDERRIVRLMISPEDALGLADVLAHTGRWLAAQQLRDDS